MKFYTCSLNLFMVVVKVKILVFQRRNLILVLEVLDKGTGTWKGEKVGESGDGDVCYLKGVCGIFYLSISNENRWPNG